MQISNQAVQVNHQFERLQERKITAVENDRPSSHSVVEVSEVSALQEQEDYQVTLTPQQQAQKKIIESISDKDASHTYKQDYLSRLALSAESQSHSHVFILQGQSVTDSSVLSVSEKRYEYEQLDYHTSLQIDDGNGSLSQHSFSLTYARELSLEIELSMTAAEFKDPLVLNIGQRAKLFEEEKQSFDLDGDGQKELIPELAAGVWYLAHDLNQNGRIDSGLELFGAQTGQGFNELASFDSNNNRIIESDDEQFSQLSLWDGQQDLLSLSQGGIKAISLNATNTPYTFTDELGNPTAQIRQTSVFIDDNNKLGAVHQVDIAV